MATRWQRRLCAIRSPIANGTVFCIWLLWNDMHIPCPQSSATVYTLEISQRGDNVPRKLHILVHGLIVVISAHCRRSLPAAGAQVWCLQDLKASKKCLVIPGVSLKLTSLLNQLSERFEEKDTGPFLCISRYKKSQAFMKSCQQKFCLKCVECSEGSFENWH